MLNQNATGEVYTNTEENMKQQGVALFAGMCLRISEVHVSTTDYLSCYVVYTSWCGHGKTALIQTLALDRLRLLVLAIDISSSVYPSHAPVPGGSR